MWLQSASVKGCFVFFILGKCNLSTAENSEGAHTIFENNINYTGKCLLGCGGLKGGEAVWERALGQEQKERGLRTGEQMGMGDKGWMIRKCGEEIGAGDTSHFLSFHVYRDLGVSEPQTPLSAPPCELASREALPL